MVTKNLLLMKKINKTFPGVKALEDVDFEINAGEVMALVGENGAGKSTLIKVLAGVHRMDSGEIHFKGEKVEISSPLEARNYGISIIYQELNLAPNLNIAENIFMGREKSTRTVFLDRKTSHREAKNLLDMVGLNIDTRKLVGELSIAQRQMVEVARALSVNSKLIVMDEPTSSLTASETDILMSIIRNLRNNGVSIIFISHKLSEIFEIADRVTVLRDGKMVKCLSISKCNEEKIIAMMVGREVKDIFAKEEAEIKETILQIKNLSTEDFLKNISFEIKRGEILGFAGLVGAGRSEVMRAIFGIDPRKSGEIYLDGKIIEIDHPYDAIKNGIGYVPEDRKLQGLILQMVVRENISLANLEDVSKRGFFNQDKEQKLAEEYITRLDIRTPGVEQKVVNLSGGNQQKVVIAKWLAIKPTVLILDEPTRGIDVKAKKEIHLLMSKLAQKGVAIIMISSELPEIIAMSDRIIVMHEGVKKGELKRGNVSQEMIMKMALSSEKALTGN